MTNGCCLYCHKKNPISFLCILCGVKMCNDIHCIIEDGTKRGTEYSVIYHSIKCSGGNGLFLDISNTEIIYILKRRIINSNIFIYMNNFGEAMNDKYLDDKYKLNKDELKKGIMKYIDMTFRKQEPKLYFKNINNCK